MSNKDIWIGLIKLAVGRKVKCNPDVVKVFAERKGESFYQARLVLPTETIYSEPELSEDNAFESLLFEVKKVW